MGDYTEYRVLHAQMYPSLVPRWEDFQHKTQFPAWLPRFILFMFICISTLSGIHTIPTVRASIPEDAMFAPWVRDLVAYGAFFAYELSIFFTAYAMLYNSSFWTWAVMGVSSAVMIASNVYQTSQAMGQDSGVMVVSYIVGFGTPLLAIFSGKLYVWIEKANRAATFAALEEFKQAQIDYDERVYQDFLAEEKRIEKMNRPRETVRITRPATPKALPAPHEYEQEVSPSKTMDRNTLREHLTLHPEDLEMTAREMESAFGVSKSVAAQVKKEVKDNA